ncbi:ribosome-associated protein [Orenia metallireducens]|jgi:ribosome-associated protein|uniref:Ribosome-associated protein n=1 Tax=Orenia metallireducens TaxID=1413210 RepID=A0A285G339_9FIRM|nr:RNA-binding S4 domain-containing protein [Orenia metallireducens]PRX31863.1 ribosome-associated protein [Orenia metallireducens]SNY17798.1 ribosome-associated protein [Orenia metallireducens]
MREIKLNTESIKLDQFLKWANLVSTGGEAKVIIKAGDVKVNGEIEERRGRTLKENDVIEYQDIEYKIITS